MDNTPKASPQYDELAPYEQCLLDKRAEQEKPNMQRNAQYLGFESREELDAWISEKIDAYKDALIADPGLDALRVMPYLKNQCQDKRSR